MVTEKNRQLHCEAVQLPIFFGSDSPGVSLSPLLSPKGSYIKYQISILIRSNYLDGNRVRFVSMREVR